MIELIDVTKIYPMGSVEVRALAGVSLRIGEGESAAIVGPSGSGKSTMMHLLGCLDRPTSGTYRLLDQTVNALGDRGLARIRNDHIGFVFQTFNLISRMSAWENVAVPLFYARHTVTRPRAMEALDRVGLADRAGHAPNELSGGERQRVAIARAIVNNPRLILADEPTGNLDTRTGEQIMQIFHELHAAGTTVVLVTHEAEIAQQAERIIAMRDGLIIDDSPSRHEASSDRAATVRGRFERQGGPSTSGPPEPNTPASERIAPAVATLERESTAATQPQTADLPSPATSAASTAPALHPRARSALVWAIVGPACLVGLVCWHLLCTQLKPLNPGLVANVGNIGRLVLLLMMFIAPIVALIHGGKGARWAKVAPARFRGRRRARIAQCVAGAYLLLMGSVLALAIFQAWVKFQQARAKG